MGLPFKKIDEFDSLFLESLVTMDKLRTTFWNCDGSKALSLDSFNLNFFKSSWSIVKNDLLSFV